VLTHVERSRQSSHIFFVGSVLSVQFQRFVRSTRGSRNGSSFVWSVGEYASLTAVPAPPLITKRSYVDRSTVTRRERSFPSTHRVLSLSLYLPATHPTTSHHALHLVSSPRRFGVRSAISGRAGPRQFPCQQQINRSQHRCSILPHVSIIETHSWSRITAIATFVCCARHWLLFPSESTFADLWL
jgi:hypothetical protein